MKRLLLAIGGNALIRSGERGTVPEQFANASRTAQEIVRLVQDGCQIVLTHGNGPQVGAALLRSERGASQVPGLSLDVCDASTQGEIGYVLQQSLESELSRANLGVQVITVITQCIVAADDQAMQHPSKPIGPFYSRADAEERRRQFGWEIVEDASRGYRRVVPSPEPLEIVEVNVIRDLMERGVLVIACGGGGIPVIRENGRLRGVDAVIDKDRASALLASQLGIELFVISTDTDYVYLDYKKPTQCRLDQIATGALARHLENGQFPAGNMGPKIESVLRFLAQGGQAAIISSGENLSRAVAGSAGTHIYPEHAGGPLSIHSEINSTVGA